MRWIALLLLAFAAAVQGQTIHKCVKGSQVTYQSDPCAAGEKHAGSWGTWTTSSPSYGRVTTPQPAQVQARATPSPQYRYSEPQGAAIMIGGAACADARAKREAWLRSPQGRDAGIDGRRAWDDFVWNACR